ncbi:MAG: GerMN domain-containing protein [Candidatus Aminicenantes bacterium]|nr:GerMN domain-containing protein [Candidatus Aminicenantes bacterium]
MDTKRLFILGALVVLVIFLAFLFFRSGGKEKIRQLSVESPGEQDQLSEQLQPKKTITLFFLSEQDSLLHPEEREIPEDPSLVHMAIQTVEELLQGSQNDSLSALPDETKLRELFITKEGIAYVDFSGEIQDDHLSGSSAEISTVFTIVNSLTFNYKSIKRVFILIEGSEKETLAGHVDLSRPLLPRYDLVIN